MDCEKYYELISLYIDDMLSASQLKELEDHIKECKQCKEEIAILQTISNDMVDLEQVDLPDDFHKELMEKIKENSTSSLKSLPTNKKWYFNMKFASAVAAVFVISVILINPFKDNSKEEALPEMANNIAQTRMIDLPGEDDLVESREEISEDAEIAAFDLGEEFQNVNYEEWTIETTDLADYQNILVDEIDKMGLKITVNQELFKEEQILDSILLELELDKDNKDYLELIIRDLEKTNTFDKVQDASSQKEELITRLVIVINRI